ncbi:hypothetical protein Leryth_018043 [Lithospermum erythrorhizon]|nr:hypothetical protein Leryth_018043 [Lithospermum erythrorhizon]
MDSIEEDHDIVIVGGGISGLATSLALHKKGFKSIVLEKSDTLRATGGAIGVLVNGWRALDQLGVATQLRQSAIPLNRAWDIFIDKGKHQELILDGETRCLKRSDLVQVLANALPSGTIRFGSQILSVKLDAHTNYPTLQLCNGKSINAKVIIGCDGSRSMVADFLELGPPRLFASGSIRGLTTYSNGREFPREAIRTRKGNVVTGTLPITDTLVYWFITQPLAQSGAKLPHDPELIKRWAIESLDGFPSDFKDLIDHCDLDSLSFTRLRYRAPWDLLLRQYRKGTVTIAGDAMHIMGPFLGQGGSASIEDAVVFARNLAQKISPEDLHQCGKGKQKTIENAIDQYLKERRMRLVLLSTQTYLLGNLLESVSKVKSFIIIIIIMILFSDNNGHTKYDCGHL